MTVEENSLIGGFGSGVLDLLDQEGLMHACTDEDLGASEPVEIVRLGLPDRFIEHGSQKELREECGLTADGIYETARSMVGKVRLSVVGGSPKSEQAKPQMEIRGQTTI